MRVWPWSEIEDLELELRATRKAGAALAVEVMRLQEKCEALTAACEQARAFIADGTIPEGDSSPYELLCRLREAERGRVLHQGQGGGV